METKDLIESYLIEPTILVFEDEQYKKSFIRNFQDKYSFSKIQYLTLAELKDCLFLSLKVTLSAEKRLVAFYNSISLEVAQHFDLRDYSDAVVFASKFFAFFEELQEANKDSLEKMLIVSNITIQEYHTETAYAWYNTTTEHVRTQMTESMMTDTMYSSTSSIPQ